MTQIPVGVKLAAENAGGFVSDMGRAHAAYGNFTKSVGDASTQIPAKSSIISGALEKMGHIAVSAAIDAGKAIAGFVVDSVKAAGDFEGGMNRFSVAVGDSLNGTGKSVGDFKSLFLSLGAELPVSTSEVQDAAIALAKGGIDPLVIAGDRAHGQMGALESSLKFAAAAGMDLQSAAELGIKMLGTFTPVTASAAEQTKFMADAQNLLVKAAGASTLDVDQLGDAMLQAGGQAKAAGVDYKDFVTAMGMISPSFGSAAEAGTSFKNFLMRLQPQTKEAKSAMGELGLVSFDTNKAMSVLASVGINAAGMSAEQMTESMIKYAKSIGMSKKDTADWIAAMDKSAFYDAQGNFVGMEKAASLLRDATKDLTAEQRSQMFQQMFGNDAMGAAIALADGGGEAYKAFADKMEKASGVNASAATMQQGFNVAMDNFKGSVEALQITIGSALLPVLTDLFNNYLAPGVNFVRDLVTQFVDAKDKTGFLSTAVSNFIPGLSGMSTAFTQAKTVIDQAMTAIQVVVRAVFGVVTTFLDENNDDIKSTFSTVWTAIQNIVKLVMQGIQEIVIPNLLAIATFINNHAETIKLIFNTAWTIIKTLITTVLGLIQAVIRLYMAYMKGDISGVLDEVKNIFSLVWNAIKVLVKTVLNLIWGIIKDVMGSIYESIRSRLDEISAYFTTIIDVIKTTVTNGFNAAKEAVASALQGMLDEATRIMGAVKDAISNAIQSAIDFITSPAVRQQFFDAGLQLIQKIIDSIVSSTQRLIDSLWSAVRQALDHVLDELKKFVSNPLGYFGLSLPSIPIFGGGFRALDSARNVSPSGYSGTVINNFQTTYHLSVNPIASTGSTLYDFGVMQALGAR